MSRYSLGIDFGTESARAVLADVGTGEETATSVYKYANGVIDERLPDSGIPLSPDYALQDPEDYLQALRITIPQVLKEACVRAEEVVGLGIDFTACTVLPTYRDGTPLCFDPQYRHNPHAWTKLWKHHAAQPEANTINAVAQERGEAFLRRYGGRISSEWLFPKIWEVLNDAPEVYQAADRFIEATDWVIWQLTGVETRNSCTAGYKGLWSKSDGFPSSSFFEALDARLTHVVDDKLSRNILPLGAKAGSISPFISEAVGLTPRTSVAVGNVDAHAAVPAATVVEPGKMVMVMGTSICHMVLGDTCHYVEGMCGVVEDGIIPGYYGYEAGQSAVGDIFAWFTENCVPESYHQEARHRGITVHGLLEEKALRLVPGEAGILALDWWNGNRSILVDADLTGMLLGYTLATRPEEVYRALIEATAFGTRTIIESFEAKGIPVDELYACGGLPEKNRLLMQVFSDVTGKEIRISKSSQAPALGAAMFGTVAAGKARGGYDSIQEASRNMAHLSDMIYRPDSRSHAVYTALFSEYRRLHDYFGRGTNGVMKLLKEYRSRAKAMQAAFPTP